MALDGVTAAKSFLVLVCSHHFQSRSTRTSAMSRNNCSVPGCRNYFPKAPKGTTWHKFPKNEELRRRWVVNIRRHVGPAPFRVSDWSFVCSAHFKPEDFRPLLHSKHRYLKLNVVPSVFPWNSEKTKESEYADNENNGNLHYNMKPDFEELHQDKLKSEICFVTEEKQLKEIEELRNSLQKVDDDITEMRDVEFALKETNNYLTEKFKRLTAENVELKQKHNDLTESCLRLLKEDELATLCVDNLNDDTISTFFDVGK